MCQTQYMNKKRKCYISRDSNGLISLNFSVRVSSKDLRSELLKCDNVKEDTKNLNKR